MESEHRQPPYVEVELLEHRQEARISELGFVGCLDGFKSRGFSNAATCVTIKHVRLRFANRERAGAIQEPDVVKRHTPWLFFILSYFIFCYVSSPPPAPPTLFCKLIRILMRLPMLEMRCSPEPNPSTRLPLSTHWRFCTWGGAALATASRGRRWREFDAHIRLPHGL